jgi:prepilin-type N-terminal cleavage/methylation domain-containing protein
MIIDSKKIKKIYLNNQKKRNGFSLVEMVTVIGIFGMIATAGFTAFKVVKDRIVLDEAQANLLFALEQARNRAATGFGTIGTIGHGVHIEEKRIVIFEDNGNGYEGAGEEIVLPNVTVSTDPINNNIIFNRISASTTASTTITINHISGEKNITVTQDGRIITQ